MERRGPADQVGRLGCASSTPRPARLAPLGQHTRLQHHPLPPSPAPSSPPPLSPPPHPRRPAAARHGRPLARTRVLHPVHPRHRPVQAQVRSLPLTCCPTSRRADSPPSLAPDRSMSVLPPSPPRTQTCPPSQLTPPTAGSTPSSSCTRTSTSSTASPTAAGPASRATCTPPSSRPSSVRPPLARSCSPSLPRLLELTHNSRPDLETLSLTPAERAFLERRCPYFPPSYLDYLSSFRFRPATQVRLTFVPLDLEGQGEREGDEYGSFELEVEGTWLETILYEVPLMSILSEAYFTHVDTHWDYVGQLGASPVLLPSSLALSSLPHQRSSALTHPKPPRPRPRPQSSPTPRAAPSLAPGASSPSLARAAAARTARTTSHCAGSSLRTARRRRRRRRVRARARARGRGAGSRERATCTLRASTTWCRSGRRVSLSLCLPPSPSLSSASPSLFLVPRSTRPDARMPTLPARRSRTRWSWASRRSRGTGAATGARWTRGTRCAALLAFRSGLLPPARVGER